ncbi:hypothetical protein DPEC_G00284890 [Dallia pectoralis]|uniref:Uncharacterized protein n=1 Tax=Dallia pectoralis TaxID=75939 RepID=A0ACC2FJG5_DALPE|nr:hypothetical protein DPEC_G00284890 [Dallia pectoralis]
MERIHLDKTLSMAVDDYLEYRRTVGEDDEGRLFSPEEYEDYKKAVLPQRLQNRLYVSFGVPGGIDCKLIGPETPCFCTHRYKQHQTDFEVVPLERPIALPCRVHGCGCSAYQYVHLNGSQSVRCRCKHYPHDHSETTDHVCRKCTSCSGFSSPYTCGCGQPSSDHLTLVEMRAERKARGRPVGRAVPYAAMGGLTGFSSLADGYLRLDDSGAEASLSVPLSQQGEAIPEHVFENLWSSTSFWTYREKLSEVCDQGCVRPADQRGGRHGVLRKTLPGEDKGCEYGRKKDVTIFQWEPICQTSQQNIHQTNQLCIQEASYKTTFQSRKKDSKLAKT